MLKIHPLGWSVVCLVMAIPHAAIASDASVCKEIIDGGGRGLYIVYPGKNAEALNSRDRQTVLYDMDARLYFLPGRIVKAGNEAVWHVRTQTTAVAEKANHALVYRAPTSTQCSNGRILPSFNENDRFVSLQRYYDHHAPAGQTRNGDPALASQFHLKVRDPSGRLNCPATDDPRLVGDLDEAYGLDVQRDPTLLASATQIGRAVAATSKTYSGISSELSYFSGAEVCIPFSVPLPTHLDGLAQFLTFMANGQIRRAAMTWEPQRTVIDIHQVVPKETWLSPIVLHWTK